jgi:hypothetical protein
MLYTTAPSFTGIYTDRYIQRIIKMQEFVGLAIVIRVFQYGELILSLTGVAAKGYSND